MKPVDTCKVYLWDRFVGAVAWINGVGRFEYSDEFLKAGLDISPITMPLEDAYPGETYEFNSLNRETFKGLPGLLADSLPDKFGNAVIDQWLASQGRAPSEFSPIERLCYIGRRGMGALEFRPAVDGKLEKSEKLDLPDLVEITQSIMDSRGEFRAEIGDGEKANQDAITSILQVGTSAQGARPKAVIAMNDKGEVRSGQVQAPEGFDYWILKLDGVSDLELGEPKGYGRIEYAYHLMAKAAGIEMSECRLLEENGRAHFMTKRFDRVGGRKLHMLSLCGMAHYDFNMPGAHSYEQAFAAMRKLALSKLEAEQQFRRAVMNVLSRNQDDHTKNIAFLMDETGEWRLSPAYDVTYAHNPKGQWTNQHQMSLSGKRDGFTLADLLALGESISLKNAREVVAEVEEAVARWPDFAEEAGVSEAIADEIKGHHRKLK